MDFATLKARLLAQIGRAPSELCYELVTSDINQNLRLSTMLASADLTTPYTLPADFLEAQTVSVGDRVLCSATEASRLRSDNTRASQFSISNGALVLDVDGEDVTMKYYASLADLSADGDTNTILTNAPSIYVYGVLAHHSALIRDPDALNIHMTAYKNFMAATQKEDNRRRMSSSNITVRARATA